jgi:hypothetical protein
MSRAFDSSTSTAFEQRHVNVITFVSLAFSSGTVYIHNGLGNYTWGGFEWLGVGDLGSVSTVEEGSDISPYGITLILSAIDPTMVGVAMNEDYYMRDVVIYVGALSDQDSLTGTPIQVWAGHMDVMSLTAGAGGGDQISLQCESELSIFDKSSNIKYTSQQLQRDYAGDLFFDFLPSIEGAKIQWLDMQSDSIAGGQSILGVGGQFRGKQH